MNYIYYTECNVTSTIKIPFFNSNMPWKDKACRGCDGSRNLLGLKKLANELSKKNAEDYFRTPPNVCSKLSMQREFKQDKMLIFESFIITL